MFLFWLRGSGRGREVVVKVTSIRMNSRAAKRDNPWSYSCCCNSVLKKKCLLSASFISCLFILSIVSARAFAQTSSVRSLITEPVDASKLSVLKGNTHPLARSEFDRGPAPDSLAMDRMQLVLKRSQSQQVALETLLAQQQNRSSPNYHKWLAPDQFSQQFGPSDQDIQTITAWLESQGFHIGDASKGRTVIEFSGTAGQVRQAFHTVIHKYVLTNGEEHWANSTDPEIPSALTPAVAGVNTLHNFSKKPLNHVLGMMRRSKETGAVKALNPQFTFAGGCNGTGTNCYVVGPYDFATIYNVNPLWNAGIDGTGQTIGIVSDSNITASDINTFRSLFGLPSNPPNIILDGSDPGLTSDETEAVLDAEWAGAVAKGATIDLVVAPSTNTTFGGDTAAEYIVDNNLAAILSYSYGTCELGLGTSGNAFYQSLWSQAATQGITVIIATGDSGSAGCDYADYSVTGSQPANYGLAVNGLASTPYDIAVGGTDFNDFGSSSSDMYWNSSNTSGTQASAKGYIPEIAYNDSCTNSIIYGYFDFTSAESACNSSTLAADDLVVPAGGSGGMSNCTTSDGRNVSSCSGGYAKPSWQVGTGVPADGKRDIPDVSLFAGDGTIQDFYVVCEADQDSGGAACNLNSPYQDFLGVGGTSVSAQAFAGLMALINQKAGARQGNANPTFYSLATEQSASSCNATGGPASSCIFYDVTTGTIAMPCAKSSPNCTVTNSNDTVGVLSGYGTATGYDLATGLGSINANNLVNAWGPSFYLSSASPAVTVSSPGASGSMTLAVTAVNGFTGTINFTCSNLPTGASCSAPSVTLSSTTTTASTTLTVGTTTSSVSVPSGNGQSISGFLKWAPITIAWLVAVTNPGWISRRRRWRASFVVLAFASLVIIAAGCGSSSSTTSSNSTTGTTTAAVTGTSSTGSPSSSMNFTVTIN